MIVRSDIDRLADAKDQAIRLNGPFCFCCLSTGYVCSVCALIAAAQNVINRYGDSDANTEESDRQAEEVSSG